MARKALQSFGAPAEVITAVSLELEDIPQKDRGLGPNILVGPIAVNGAEPGDVLEVKIIELHPADNYAENLDALRGPATGEDSVYSAGQGPQRRGIRPGYRNSHAAPSSERWEWHPRRG
jgi:hypothetical protein